MSDEDGRVQKEMMVREVSMCSGTTGTDHEVEGKGGALGKFGTRQAPLAWTGAGGRGGGGWLLRAAEEESSAITRLKHAGLSWRTIRSPGGVWSN